MEKCEDCVKKWKLCFFMCGDCIKFALLFKRKKTMQHLARFFSNLFSPLLMPTYGIFLLLWVSILCYLPFGSSIVVLLVILGITCILPIAFIAVLHTFGIIQDKRLIDRRERFLPYVFILMCYAAAAFYLINVHSPMWVVSFMWGATAAVAVSFGINFAWKISGHMGGIGGIVAMLFCLHNDGLGAFDLKITICTAIILSGVVATSRMILERHNFWQLAAGFCNGFVCVYLMSKLLY